jgi:hypothetical protein
MSLFTGGLAVAAIIGSQTATTIYGAKKATKAAQVESAGAAAALDYTKQKDAQERADSLAAQKANYEQWSARERRLAPYRGGGQGASQTIAALLGLPAVDIPEPAPPPSFLTPPPSGATTATTPATSGPTSNVTGSQNVGTMASLTGSGMVTMTGPNGGPSRAIPAYAVEHYKKLGAQVVN